MVQNVSCMDDTCTTHNNKTLAKKGMLQVYPAYKNLVPRFPKEKERRNTGLDNLLEPCGYLLKEVER